MMKRNLFIALVLVLIFSTGIILGGAITQEEQDEDLWELHSLYLGSEYNTYIVTQGDYLWVNILEANSNVTMELVSNWANFTITLDMSIKYGYPINGQAALIFTTISGSIHINVLTQTH